MRLLALETSGAIGSVALADGGSLLERSVPTPREQTELMLPLVEALLAEAGLALTDLDAIVFGRGPGSFTGLRIAAALAQGLALAADRPIVAVSSLEALAQRAWREHASQRSLVCVDARMGEVYTAAFAMQSGRADELIQERLVAPTAVEAPRAWRAAPGWTAIGSGWAAHPEAFAELLTGAYRIVPDLAPAARDLLPRAGEKLRAGEIETPETALPVYLRGAGAWRPGARS